MPKKCIHCHETKSSSEFHERETACKDCKKNAKTARRLQLREDVRQLTERVGLMNVKQKKSQHISDDMQNQITDLVCTVEQVEFRKVAKLQKDIADMNATMKLHQQIIAKTGNTMNEMVDKIGAIFAENTELRNKVRSLETQNRRMYNKIVKLEMDKNLRSIVEMGSCHTDDVDEIIQRNVSVLETLYNKTLVMEMLAGDTRNLVDAINDKVDSHHEMQLEIGDAYYKYIVGNGTRYDVKRRLDKIGCSRDMKKK